MRNRSSWEDATKIVKVSLHPQKKCFFDSQSNERFRHGNAMAIKNWMEKLKHVYGASVWDQDHNFGSIYWEFVDERVKKTLCLSFKEIRSENHFRETFIFGFFIDFSVTSKVFELLTSALAHIKRQVILCITAKDEVWDSGSFAMLSFYFPPLELVHRVKRNNFQNWN